MNVSTLERAYGGKAMQNWSQNIGTMRRVPLLHLFIVHMHADGVDCVLAGKKKSDMKYVRCTFFFQPARFLRRFSFYSEQRIYFIHFKRKTDTNALSDLPNEFIFFFLLVWRTNDRPNANGYNFSCFPFSIHWNKISMWLHTPHQKWFKPIRMQKKEYV